MHQKHCNSNSRIWGIPRISGPWLGSLYKRPQAWGTEKRTSALEIPVFSREGCTCLIWSKRCKAKRLVSSWVRVRRRRWYRSFRKEGTRVYMQLYRYLDVRTPSQLLNPADQRQALLLLGASIPKLWWGLLAAIFLV